MSTFLSPLVSPVLTLLTVGLFALDYICALPSLFPPFAVAFLMQQFLDRYLLFEALLCLSIL